ncbi:MAG: hypothetical protein ACLRMN_13305 [Mediterraneibacter gnavus]
MYDVIIIGAGVSGSAIARESCPGIRENFVYWKKKQISVVERPKQTVGLFMQDLMQKKAL